MESGKISATFTPFIASKSEIESGVQFLLGLSSILEAGKEVWYSFSVGFAVEASQALPEGKVNQNCCALNLAVAAQSVTPVLGFLRKGEDWIFVASNPSIFHKFSFFSEEEIALVSDFSVSSELVTCEAEESVSEIGSGSWGVESGSWDGDSDSIEGVRIWFFKSAISCSVAALLSFSLKFFRSHESQEREFKACSTTASWIPSVNPSSTR